MPRADAAYITSTTDLSVHQQSTCVIGRSKVCATTVHKITGQPRTCPEVAIVKATQQGAAPVRRGSRLECTGWGTHWRNLANTTETFVCGCDAALRQITLITSFVNVFIYLFNSKQKTHRAHTNAR